VIPATKTKKPRKVQRPRPGTRAENLINEDPKAIAGRVKKALTAFLAKIEPDMTTLMAGDGGMEAVMEKFRADLEKFQEELDGTVSYLNEQLG